MTINLTNINAGLADINAALPILTTAYTLLKEIWLRTNPGKTEADYLTYLATTSTTNLTDSAAILTADGYVEQADGSWKKPAA